MRRRFALVSLLALNLALTGGSAALAGQATPVTDDALPWWRKAVCYEIFVRSFADSNGDGNGDFRGLTERLDYLNDGDPAGGDDLGVDCVWLMPIMEAASYHGYDVTDYDAVESDYGTRADFATLMEAAHQRGIRIIIDLPLNHTSNVHPWFIDAATNPDSPVHDWYVWSESDPAYPGPWGQDVWYENPEGDDFYYSTFWEGMPDLDYRNPEVTAEAHRISRFWLEEMRVDGFRLDAIKHLIEESPKRLENTDATHQWLRDYRSFLASFAPDAYTVGEIFGASTTLLLPYYPDQLDAHFQFDIAGQILSAAGSASASGSVTITAEADEQIPDDRWATFLSNHDQTRSMTTLSGDTAAAKLAATALLTLPGTPFIYYGEELGMTGNKPDERLRTPMPWTAEPTGGFTTGEPWEPFADDPVQLNVAAQLNDPDSLLRHYQAMIRLRNEHPALSYGEFIPLRSRPSAVAAFVRETGDERLLIVINFGDEPVEPSLSTRESRLPGGSYHLEPVVGAEPGAKLTVAAEGAIDGFTPTPTLPPQSAAIFSLSSD
jgi:glycosidase